MKYYAILSVVFLAGYFGFSAFQIAAASKKQAYICWAKPTAEAVKRCEESRTCNGSGTYAKHLKKIEATRLALALCAEEFGSCELDYCDKVE